MTNKSNQIYNISHFWCFHQMRISKDDFGAKVCAQMSITVNLLTLEALEEIWALAHEIERVLSLGIASTSSISRSTTLVIKIHFYFNFWNYSRFILFPHSN
jgi:hypothetical protein